MNKYGHYHVTNTLKKELRKGQVQLAIIGTAIALSIMAIFPPPTYASEGCEKEIVIPTVPQIWAHKTVHLINLERRKVGVPPLKVADELVAAARYHLQDMLDDDYYHTSSHDRIDGELVEVCQRHERIGLFYPDYTYTDEILNEGLYSYPFEKFVVQSWIDYDFTRGRMLEPAYWEAGVAYNYGDRIMQTWVANFGQRPNVYPIIINDEAETTDIDDIAIYLYGDWQEVRFQINEGAWSEWMPFENEMYQTLSDGAGEMMVTAEMRTDTLSTTSSDTIMRDPDPTAVQTTTISISVNMPMWLFFTAVLTLLTMRQVTRRPVS